MKKFLSVVLSVMFIISAVPCTFAEDGHIHTPGNAVYETVTEPDCTTAGKGVKIIKCTGCGEEISREDCDIPAEGHFWSKWETVRESTCTEKGLQKRTCTVCNEPQTQETEINPAKHTGTTVLKNEEALTCTHNGYTGDLCCAGCGAVIKAGTTLYAEGHFFGQWETVRESTCSVKGEKQRICSVCGEKETAETELNPANHKGRTEIRNQKDASVGEDGYTGDTYCTDCGALLTEGEIIPALHLVCDADGSNTVTVADARIILRAAIGMNGMTEGNDIYSDADGDCAVTVADARIALRTAIKLNEEKAEYRDVTEYTAPTCAGYGKAFYTVDSVQTKLTIPKRQHTDEVVSTVEATCTQNGLITKKCAVCGRETTQKINATGHTPGGAADCTHDSVCTVCGEVITRATGHNFAAATCVKPKTCTVCGATEGEALGHSYLPATCERASTCSRCGATTGLPLGHNYAAATYSKPATCTRCGATKGDPLGTTYSSKGYKITTVNGFTYCDGLLIVNKTYTVPSSYNPGDLTSECRAAFNKMVAGAKQYGLTLWVQSGYRSYSTQTYLYNRYVSRDGKAAADTYSARPGHSEHQTGLAIDVNSVSSSFANTKEGIWLAAHCAEYGFILRYPKGKESKTGYMYEPWHVRYVGSVELAKKITASGLYLEEYYGLTSQYS